MNTRALVMLGVAVGLGGVAVVLARSVIQAPAPQVPVAAAPAPELPNVVVAKGALAFGKKLTASDLKIVPWPADAVPAGAFSSVDQLTADGGRVVLRALEPGEPVLPNKISGPGGRATLSTLIAGEMRAVTIRVNDVNGVAGFVLPGDRVDVMMTRDRDPENPVNAIILQNVKVLGVDQEISERKDTPIVARAVTVEVTPEEAQKLTLGSTVGSLSLALRHHTDGDAPAARPVGLSDLVAPPSAPLSDAPAAVAAAPAYTVRVVRGTAQEEVSVSRDPGVHSLARRTAPKPTTQPAPQEVTQRPQ